MKVKLVSKLVLPFGYGIYLPFGYALVRRDSMNISYVIAHEAVHHSQRQAHCCYLTWLITILWQYLVYGYHNAPYEVAARRMGRLNQYKYIKDDKWPI